MGPETKQYRETIIDIAKVIFFDRHSDVFEKNNSKIRHIKVVKGQRKGCFMLNFSHFSGYFIEEVFKYSDF